MSKNSFVHQINGVSLSALPINPYTSRNSFPEFYSSAFPACSELSCSNEELEEMRFAAALLQPWALHDEDPNEAVRWYLDSFDKEVPDSEGVEDPKFYPLGFIGIENVQWKEKDVGVVLVYFDVTGRQADDESVTVKAFRLDPEKIGAALISLRQGDDDIRNVMRHCGIE